MTSQGLVGGEPLSHVVFFLSLLCVCVCDGNNFFTLHPHLLSLV